MAGGSFELYLIRHAIAEERGEKWPDDNKRPLTEEGIARMRKAARGLARVGVTLDAVLTSPLVRARQTAEIVAAASDSKPPLVNVESLTPDGGYAAIVADLEKHARKAVRIALVGHEPLMGELAGRIAPDRIAPSDRVPERRGMPNRSRFDSAGGPRRSPLDAHTQNSAAD